MGQSVQRGTVRMQRKEIIKRVQSQTKGGLFVALVFGLVFLGIGLTTIISLWTAKGFGAPPLFFRIAGSLIAIAFIAMGGTVAYASGQALAGKHDTNPFSSSESPESPGDSAGQVGYICPGCGAPLARGADVSPHGDVKCAHCGRWFNVHKTG